MPQQTDRSAIYQIQHQPTPTAVFTIRRGVYQLDNQDFRQGIYLCVRQMIQEGGFSGICISDNCHNRNCIALSFCSGDGTYSFFKVSPFLFLLCFPKSLKHSRIVIYNEKILQEKLIFVFYNGNIIQFIFFIKRIYIFYKMEA